jgi:hypothetical protein
MQPLKVRDCQLSLQALARKPLTCMFGAPGRTRTCTLRIRSRFITVHDVSSSAILPAQVQCAVRLIPSCPAEWRVVG